MSFSPGIDPNISEEDFQKQIIELAHMYGWLVHHSRKVQTIDGKWITPIQGDKGYFDLTMARDGKRIIAELKTEKGKPTEEQWKWYRALGKSDENTLICGLKPSNWGEIEEAIINGRWDY